jgi:hypothetical protein
MTTTLNLRSPEDLLAAAPVVLGFVPTDSAVMFTFDGPICFHARVDLPQDGLEIDACVDTLLAPCLHHEVGRVLFLLFTDDPDAAARVTGRLVPAFRGAGIGVIDVLRADGRRWYPLLGSRVSVPLSGVPYDVSAHPFLTASVLHGRVTHRSRAELEATLAPDPGAVARVAAAAPDADVPPPDASWLLETVVRHVDAGSAPDAAETARLLRCLDDTETRDVALRLLRRPVAEAHARLWADVVRRAPEDYVAPAAALLGFAAWVWGHGALAWCAVDRCLAADPGHGIAHQLARILTHAVPPSLWEEVAVHEDPVQTLAARAPDP